MKSKDFKSKLKSLKGTCAVENMQVSEDGIKNLIRIEGGEISYARVIEELKQKYTQKTYNKNI